MESFTGKLRYELLNGETFDTLLEAQVVTEAWRIDYNTIRPHSSLRLSSSREVKVLRNACSNSLVSSHLGERRLIRLDATPFDECSPCS